MLGSIPSCALLGIDAFAVVVEVDVASGLPGYHVVGLPAASVREGAVRIRSALEHIGQSMPNKKITVNLAPADRRKEGAAFDLPIAIGILIADDLVKLGPLEGLLLLGELGLDGSLRPIRGALSAAILARDKGMRGLLVPASSAAEAAAVEDIEVYAAAHLADVVAWLDGTKPLARVSPPAAGQPLGPDAQEKLPPATGLASRDASDALELDARGAQLPAAGLADASSHAGRPAPGSAIGTPRRTSCRPGRSERRGAMVPAAIDDMSDVRGQQAARAAIEVAVAGGHNILLTGPPGIGKTMLARRIPSILPPMTYDETLETTQIYSAVGLARGQLVRERPFRAPHHSISAAALLGGGRIPRPGEISLAHNGVLFLDELPEFQRFVIESLRQPLEDRFVTVGRVQGTVTLPSSFLLVASANPCPCGWLGSQRRVCTCGARVIARYRNKLSGPLLDRIDLQIFVQSVELLDLRSDKPAESSATVRARVVQARAVQRQRLLEYGCRTNAEMPVAAMQKTCKLSTRGERMLERLAEVRKGMTARAINRLIRVSRTIADLLGRDAIDEECLAEAAAYRALDSDPGCDVRYSTPPDACGRGSTCCGEA